MTFHDTLPGIVDRRRLRSDDALIAMGHQLGRVLEDFALDACVVSTRDGLLLATPPNLDPRQSALLAAAAPSVWRDHGDTHALAALTEAGVDTDRSTLHVEPFDVQGQRMFVITVGDRAVHPHAIERCVGGITRIMHSA